MNMDKNRVFRRQNPIQEQHTQREYNILSGLKNNIPSIASQRYSNSNHDKNLISNGFILNNYQKNIDSENQFGKFHRKNLRKQKESNFINDVYTQRCIQSQDCIPVNSTINASSINYDILSNDKQNKKTLNQLQENAQIRIKQQPIEEQKYGEKPLKIRYQAMVENKAFNLIKDISSFHLNLQKSYGQSKLFRKYK